MTYSLFVFFCLFILSKSQTIFAGTTGTFSTYNFTQMTYPFAFTPRSGLVQIVNNFVYILLHDTTAYGSYSIQYNAMNPPNLYFTKVYSMLFMYFYRLLVSLLLDILH